MRDSRALPHLMQTPVLQAQHLVLRGRRASGEPSGTDVLNSERSCFIGTPPAAGRGRRTFAALAGHRLLRGGGGMILRRPDGPVTAGQIGPWLPGDCPERAIGRTPSEAGVRGQVDEARRASVGDIVRDLRRDRAVSFINHPKAEAV